jgi:radical SAM protein with 4Fe4S-binding SPASM domain
MIRLFYYTKLFPKLRQFINSCFLLAEKFICYNYDKTKNPTISIETIRNYNNNRTLGPQKRICNAPFKNMYLNANGNITACCMNNVDIFGNIKNTNLKKAWNGEKANSLRNKIDNFDLSGGCSICKHFLEAKDYNAYHGSNYDSFFEKKKYAFPEEMTFEISNTCNLECIMCNEKLSSLIRKNRYHLAPLDNNYGAAFFEELKEFLPHLKKARFVGGEPFLINEFYQIFDLLFQHNPDCKIAIQTNGTVLNEKVKKIVQHKNVELSISIDSLDKELYNTIRKNSSFEKVMSNIDYFKNDALKRHKLVNINFCVMTNNWQETPAMIEYCNKNSFLLHFIPVVHPNYLSLKSLNPAYLKHIHETLSAERTTKSVAFTQLLDYIKSLEEYSRNQKIKKELLLQKNEQQLIEELNNLYSIVSNYYVNNHLFNSELLIKTIKNALEGHDDEKRRQVLADIILQTIETEGEIKLYDNTTEEILAAIRIQVEDLLKKNYNLCY